MITEISLHNWKSFEDSTLLIDQITFLIGTNASGKSNIVDALMFLSRLSGGERLAEVCKSIRGGIDQIIRRGCDETKISVTFKSENSEYRYSISFSVDRADAFINEESLELRLRDDSWRSLFNTDPITPGDSCGQITARFDKDRPGPRKGISLRRDMTVLSQIQGQVVLKQIKDGAKATLDSFASIYVLDPSPAKCVSSLLFPKH